MPVSTKEALQIFWNGHEANGVLVYGYFNTHCREDFSIPVENWGRDAEQTRSVLTGPGWNILQITVLLPSMNYNQDDFDNSLCSTLKWIVDNGALASWAGREGKFCDPPELFSDDCMPESVYAYYTKESGYHNKTNISGALSTFTESELADLRKLIYIEGN